MPIKPGPVSISFTVGASSYDLQAETINVTYETQPFDRVEFSSDKLKSVPLANGAVPQIVQLLGGIPAEIVIDCAVGPDYIPRPLLPDVVPTDTDLIKKRINITRYKVSVSSPEASCLASIVDSVLGYVVTHKNLLTQFANRLAIFNGAVAYEQLLTAQADDIAALYFTTGVTFTAPGYSVSDVMIVDGSFSDEFRIPDGLGGFVSYKTFDLVLEKRTVSAASAA